jgi:stage V sporulation protein B
MSKAANMAKISAKGSFNLLLGMVSSTVISAIGTIIIANIMGETNYGLYTIAIAAPNLISLFSNWGVGSAITKYTAQYNAEGKTANIRKIFASGIIFQTFLGIALSVFAFLISGLLADLYSLPNIAPLIQIASLMILTGALLSTTQAAFTGFEKLEMNSTTLVVQSIVRTALSIILVSAGFGSSGATIGITMASLIACLTGGILIWTLFKSLPKTTQSNLKTIAAIKMMLSYGIPLSIATIIGALQIQFYSFFLPIFVSPDLVGNYGVASSFVVLITFFSTPITTVLFPAFSKLDPKKDHETLKNVFQFSIKYSSLFVIPVTFIVMTLSQPGISLLFPQYTAAPLFLTLLASNYLYNSIGNQSVTSLLNGQGQTTFSLKLALIQAAIGFPLSIILIPRFGVIGLIVTALADGCPGLVVALWWINKKYGVTVNWISSIKIVLSSLIVSAITYTSLLVMPFGNLIKLIAGAIIFIVTLVIVVLLTRTVTRSDLSNLREMLANLGTFRRLFNFLLDCLEKIMNILRL